MALHSERFPPRWRYEYTRIGTLACEDVLDQTRCNSLLSCLSHFLVFLLYEQHLIICVYYTCSSSLSILRYYSESRILLRILKRAQLTEELPWVTRGPDRSRFEFSSLTCHISSPPHTKFTEWNKIEFSRNCYFKKICFNRTYSFLSDFCDRLLQQYMLSN
jgi:hypothetical protein